MANVGIVQQIRGQKAVVSFSGALQEVSIALLPHVKIADHVIVHAGFAAEIVKDVSRLYRDVVATDAQAGHILDAIAREMQKSPGKQIRIMNFCGSHEHTVVQYGLRELLPEKIKLVSGPGCPVCVTPAGEIALGLAAARQENVTLTTFGDLVRVPTPWGSLEQLRADGADVRIINDANQALHLARSAKGEVVHFAIGFETTAPLTAALIKEAEDIRNFSVISSHRVTPPAMEYVLSRHEVDAVLCPGHVAMIIGAAPFRRMFARCRIPYVISGFTPLDILQGILILLQQMAGLAETHNQYARVVEERGNGIAQELIREVFTLTDAHWRGFDTIPASRLVLRDKYRRYDAESRFGLHAPRQADTGENLCRCGDVLRGAEPGTCAGFARDCTPDHPLGPCMVSREGACSISYQNRNK